MRWRTPALVGGWALAVVVATGVGWAGVNLVADEVSPSGSSALSQAEVERRIHAASASTSASTSPSNSATPAGSPGGSSGASGPVASGSSAAAAPTPVRRSATARGGSVVLECTGALISAKSSPRPGYTVSEDPTSSGTEVQVVFSNGSASSQVQGRCAGGVPVSSVHETQGSGGSGGDD